MRGSVQLDPGVQGREAESVAAMDGAGAPSPALGIGRFGSSDSGAVLSLVVNTGSTFLQSSTCKALQDHRLETKLWRDLENVPGFCSGPPKHPFKKCQKKH